MDAEGLAEALGGKRVGTGWSACCPAHDDRRPSLSIRDRGDKVLVYCHAGCPQHTVIAALREQGLWSDRKRVNLRRAPTRAEQRPQHDQSQAERTAVALSIWRSTVPAVGTLAQVYLAARGLTLPVPPSIRFHPRLKYPSGRVKPCMVALVTKGDQETPVAIHRTFLAPDGTGKARVDNPRLMLGPCGGGAVRLGQPGQVLMVGEGIETCLAAMQATGNPAWAALSTSGLRGLHLPERVRDVIVLADGDDRGEEAARECAFRFVTQGRRVRVARPGVGQDFNDLLVGNEGGSGASDDVR